ncbi:DUF3987 domain-containing protein [Salinimicrobium sp. TH3]|uniref:DUF3987 domain-containing protein n=1 Tax=Salinimicrobium sp. TH3 TaxID=2997342 RepID=UPI002275A171|nr:DUF3987 domain-containing protein [Salinimicrobium sp. TH3]MCY2687566.1 DUF3987 domain-containing protein [Salinimicrobium sp. TH3]
MEVDNLKDIEEAILEHSSSLEDKAVRQLHQIVNKLPPYIGRLINEAFEHKRIPKEYLLTSILFAFSNTAGLAIRLDAMGYSNYGNIYAAIIGSRGDVKSPAMDLATEPLKLYDDVQYRNFIEKTAEEGSEENVVRKQLFIQDATVEAAYFKHHENPFSLGIFMDELYYLIEKMGNPASKDGPAWRILLLQGNTNKLVDISRKTTLSFRLSKSYPVLLGSIQQEFIPKIFSGGNLESGFTDRLLFAPNLTHNTKLSKFNISQDCLKKYSDNLLRMMEYRKPVEESDNKEPLVLTCTPDAEDRLFNYTQNILHQQEKSEEIEKGYLAKVLINIHKIVILTHLMKESASPELHLKIGLETVEDAIMIMDFYFTNFQIIVEKLEGNLPDIDPNEVVKLGRRNNATQEQIAAVLGVNKSTVSRKIARMKI